MKCETYCEADPFNSAWRRFKENGKIVLCLHGAWSDEMLAELKNGQYDYVQLDQVYDWDSFFPFIENYAGMVKQVSVDFHPSLKGLETFVELESLGMSLDGAPSSPPDLSVFKKLKGASFYWHKKYGSAIAELPELTSLVIFGYAESDCSVLGKVKKLTSLSLTRGKVESLEGIQNLALENVQLNYLRNLIDIGALATQRGLKKLSIENVAKIADLRPITRLHELEYLSLFNCGSLPNLDWVSELGNIAKLWVPVQCEQVNWDVLLSRPTLEMLAVKPPQNALRTEDELLEIAARHGKTITDFHVVGTKKAPIYTFEFSETRYREKHDRYFDAKSA